MESYANLPDSIRKKITWDSLAEKIWYEPKTDMKELTLKTVKAVNQHRPYAKVVDNIFCPFGAVLDVPGKGLGRISFNGLSVEEVVKLLDSRPEFVKEVYTPNFDAYYRSVVLKDGDSTGGSKVGVSKAHRGFLSGTRPCVELEVWPQNDESKKLLRTLTDQIKDWTMDWE